MYKRLPALLLFLLATHVSLAQTVRFSTALSASKIGTDDQLQVSYTLENGAQPTGISNPDFKNFKLLSGPHRSSSSSINISASGTEERTTLTFTYVVQPTRTGRFVLPALFLKLSNGQTYKSEQATVEVVQGTVAQQRPARRSANPFADDMDEWWENMQRQQQQAINSLRNQMRQQQQQQQSQIEDFLDADKNLFMRVVTDKTSVYLGEQITATYKLYARVPMQMSISKLPMLKGFWTQDFKLPSEAKPVRETYQGRLYEVFTLKKSALFPQQSGKLTLDAAEADGVAQQFVKSEAQDPFGFNDPFFGGGGGVAVREVPVKLRSQPVSITVKPLPEAGKPVDFTGAVGHFTHSLEVDKTKATTDDVITLTLTINGTGNLKLITPPNLAVPEGLSILDPSSTDTFNAGSTAINGKKIIVYTITPNEPGQYKIQPIPFSYFNPATGQYQTLHTPIVELAIDKGKNYLKQQRKRDKAPILSLRPLLSGALPAATHAPYFWIDKGWYWALQVLPLLALVAVAVARKRQQAIAGDVRGYKLKTANRVALRRLKQAHSYLKKNQKDPFYEEISKALWLYVSDKIHLPLAELSKEKGLQLLDEKGVSQALRDRVNTLSDDAAAALYAPNISGAMQRDYEKAVVLIRDLEVALKPREKASTHKTALVLFTLLSSFSTWAQTPEKHWQQGIAAYQDQRFEVAVQEFSKAAALQKNNGAIYFNLGNSLFKTNDFVGATLAFKRALLYDPHHEAAYQNLMTAQSRIPGLRPPGEPAFFVKWYQSAIQSRHSNAWAAAALLCFVAGCMLIERKMKGRLHGTYANPIVAGCLLLFALTISLAFMARRQENGANDAMVLQPTALTAKKNDPRQSVLLPAGSLLSILGEAGEWSEVTTADGQRGWLSKNSYEKVKP